MQIVLTFFLLLLFCTAEMGNDALKISMLQISEKHCQTGHQNQKGKKKTLSKFFLKRVKEGRHGKVDNRVM